MSSELIKNKTKVFYTIHVNDETTVTKVERVFNEFYLNVRSKADKEKVWTTDSLEFAQKVAVQVGAKITKHTRTEVITEVTESVEV